MISINKKRCIRCGLCVQTCNSGVFSLENGTPVVTHEDRCNRCSHCLAVCPEQAVVHAGLAGKRPARIQRRRIQPQAYRETVASRRSVRRYKPDPVSRKLVEDILDLARYSPTASNAQNVHYTVVTRRTLLDEVSRRLFSFGDRIYQIYTQAAVQRLSRLAGALQAKKSLDRYAENWLYYREQIAKGRDLLFYSAPALLLIHAPRGQVFSRDNCLIAATNIDNYAQALGLGSCFLGILVAAMQIDRSLNRTFGIPKGHKVYAALTLGYPAVTYSYHAVRGRPAVQWLSENA